MRLAPLALAVFALTAAPNAAAQAGPRAPLYVRLDVGLNGPSGVFSAAFGGLATRSVGAELSGGLGLNAGFLGGTFRFRMLGDVWRFGLGLGGHLGRELPNGLCCLERFDPNTLYTGWLHQEFAFQRVGAPGIAFFSAFGIEELVSGAYHVDFGDVNLVDRRALSIRPYLRFGIGANF